MEQTNDEDKLLGVQSEIAGTGTNENKDLGKRVKGRKKPHSKKIIELGAIPEGGSKIFKGLSFILPCTVKFDRQKEKSDSNSDTEFELEKEWQKHPFNREYLKKQIINGGGKFYENFDDIPEGEYQKTMHITNLPNRSRTGLLCLSVGIRSIDQGQLYHSSGIAQVEKNS